ncbi:uncharacterized protein LOC134212504 [Armigeres subalbatus]|uniref:uncharacterized protein LOC134212504 n=1 Tax=Armigeres subalbatus TaxID=124917 RepID=UPI002ED07BEC
MQRYQLNLSDFFTDHRQKVFVGKRDKWKRISCLTKHVRCVFGLNQIFITNDDGVLFMEEDNLDVIRESDLLRVHPSNSSKVAQQICAPGRALVAPGDNESRVSDVKQNGKRVSDAKENNVIKHMQSSSDSESDDDDDNALPKIFLELESVTRKDGTVDDIPTPKRKRIRKRKSKKKKEDSPQKVVVKTYGKGKVPSIIQENGAAPNHIRFSKDDSHEDNGDNPAKDEPYRNLNKTTIARVVKAALQHSDPIILNDETPPIPDYVDDVNMDDTVINSHRKLKTRKPKKQLEVKQELIDTNTKRAASPTWDTELDEAKEKFLSEYTGEEFWLTLREALDNFPAISIPSTNDVIAYSVSSEHDQTSYLAFVERAIDGDSDASPALKLSLRRLNTTPSNGASIMYTLDQLTGIRLVATYQP